MASTTASAEPFMAVSDLHAGYGSLQVLTGVDLELNRGEFGLIAAPNGAGKTTLMNSMAGLISRRGRVFLDGDEVGSGSPERSLRSGIALVPENRQLFPELSVMDNLIMGGYIWQSRRSRRSDKAQRLAAQQEMCVELFPILGRRADQAAGTLSGGEQQMLAISRALMSLPRVLLLDEPTLGLAPKVVFTLRDTLIQLCSSELSILVAEQNSRAFLEVAHKTWNLVDGKTRRDLEEKPSNAVTA